MPIVPVSPIVNAAALALAEGRRCEVFEDLDDSPIARSGFTLEIEIKDANEAEAIRSAIGQEAEDTIGDTVPNKMRLVASFLAANVECTGRPEDLVIHSHLVREFNDSLSNQSLGRWMPRTASVALKDCAGIYVDPVTHHRLSWGRDPVPGYSGGLLRYAEPY